MASEITIDEDVVFLDGEPLRISPNQARIFDVLWQRRNRIVQTWALWDAQWMDEWPETAGDITRVHIHYLRKALKSSPFRIRNFPSRGYMLVANQ